MAFCPEDTPGVSYEFFSPFVHVAGKYEWCRIRSPTHGVFDTFILLGPTTADPACVYVNSVLGEAFMAERYPECTTIRVAPGGLRIEASPDGCTIDGVLEAEEGPLRKASMRFQASPQQLPRQQPYGGDGKPTWGGRWTCWGVDLELDATVDGRLEPADGEPRELRGVEGIVTMGSFGRLEPTG